MGLNYALYSAVTGLDSNSSEMSIISDDIANANTKAFKTVRGEFEDMIGVSLNENSQLGRGSRLRNTTTIFNQGALTSTGIITDLSIQHDGFFVMKNGKEESNNNEGLLYTRQGSFRFDKDGKLVDPSGAKVQGYMPDPENPNRLSPALSDLQIVTDRLAPRSTGIVNIVANLDVRDKAPAEPFDPARAADTSNFSSSINIYDNYGNGRQATIHYSRTNDTDKNKWNWYVTVDGNEVSNDPKRNADGKVIPAIIGQGMVEFDKNGKPLLPYKSANGDPIAVDLVGKKDSFDVQFVNGAKLQKIQLNFGPTILDDGTVNSHQLSTSIAARSGISFHSQDGYDAGYLKTIRVDSDGTIVGAYTNGLERKIGAVALAVFPNNQGLVKMGGNKFYASSKAGAPRIGAAQTGGRGSIFSATLEESNVDLSKELVNMITTERGFQANSKGITAVDAMMQTVVDMKR